jgi:serine/threonine protein kinase
MHDKGVIHRDLNPTNVFLAEKDFIKLLDFNVSKMIDEQSLK